MPTGGPVTWQDLEPPDVGYRRTSDPDPAVARLVSEVLYYAIKDLRQPRGVQSFEKPKVRASAAVFLGSNRATPWLSWAGLDHRDVLEAIDYARLARAALEGEAAKHMTDREREVVRGAIEHLEA